MGVLWVLLHQAEPRSEGSTQLMLHAIARGTCLRFCIWEAPGLKLKTKFVLTRALLPKEAPFRADGELSHSSNLGKRVLGADIWTEINFFKNFFQEWMTKYTKLIFPYFFKLCFK